MFVFRSGNYSALVGADTQEGVYIKADAVATTAGAWVRSRQVRTYEVRWFGASTARADNQVPIDAAVELAKTEGGGTIFISEYYATNGVIVIDGADINLQGTNRSAGVHRTTTGGQTIQFTGQRHSARDLLFASTLSLPPIQK